MSVGTRGKISRANTTDWRTALFATRAPGWSILIRLLVGLVVFFPEGIQKLVFPDILGAGRFTHIGIPYPDFTGPFVGVVEIVCGALIILGLLTRLAAVPLIVIMIVAIVSTRVSDPARPRFLDFSRAKNAALRLLEHDARGARGSLHAARLALPRDRRRRKMVAGRAAEPKPIAVAGGIKRTGDRTTDMASDQRIASDQRASTPFEVLRAFSKLGVSCFGGPIAHIGYFREEFVVRRRWLDEQAFVDLVALCQFLPGPASSQVGFSIGLMRGGYLGGLAAWTGFTLPSAIILVLFAYGAGALSGPIGSGLLHGLKLVAVAIVAQAVWGMARTLCPDRERASIAVVAALIILFSTSSVAQIGAIAIGGVAGLWLCRGAAAPPPGGHMILPVSRTAGLVALACFLCVARRPADLTEPVAGAGGGLVRRILPFGRTGLWRRSRRPAAVTSGIRCAGLGQRQHVPRRLWRGAGGSGAALHFCRLSRHRGQPFATWRSWRSSWSDRYFSSRYIDPARHAAVLGQLPKTSWRAGHNARRQRRRRRSACSRSLQSGLDQFGQRRGDFAVALVAFVLLTVWRAPPLLVVIVSALGGAGLALADWLRRDEQRGISTLLCRPFAEHVPSRLSPVCSPISRRRCSIRSCRSF